MDGHESTLRNADNQTWLIDLGHAILEKRRSLGNEALTPRERLILCFWTADYSMRRAGDLATARTLDPHFLADARVAASALGLPFAIATFAMSEGEFERVFFDRFDGLCSELRGR